MIAHHVLNFSGKKATKPSCKLPGLGPAGASSQIKQPYVSIRWCHKSWHKLQVAANDSITQPSNQLISSVYGCAWFISGFAIWNLICIQMLKRHNSALGDERGNKKKFIASLQTSCLCCAIFIITSPSHLCTHTQAFVSCSPHRPSNSFPSNDVEIERSWEIFRSHVFAGSTFLINIQAAAIIYQIAD